MNDKWIDILKWFIGSVVIVVVTIIIDTGFKEREAGIKEMEVYDKYVDIILKADNIEQRWKLCEYFSIVTPTERLRTRWQSYKDTISSDYYQWKNIRKRDSLDPESNNLPLFTSVKQQEDVYENLGFESLKSKEWQKSIDYFSKAESIKPGLHNCYEILNFLKQNSELKDISSPKWKDFYGKLSTDFSWGMPKSLIEEFDKLSK